MLITVKYCIYTKRFCKHSKEQIYVLWIFSAVLLNLDVSVISSGFYKQELFIQSGTCGEEEAVPGAEECGVNRTHWNQDQFIDTSSKFMWRWRGWKTFWILEQVGGGWSWSNLTTSAVNDSLRLWSHCAVTVNPTSSFYWIHLSPASRKYFFLGQVHLLHLNLFYSVLVSLGCPYSGESGVLCCFPSFTFLLQALSRGRNWREAPHAGLPAPGLWCIPFTSELGAGFVITTR